MTAAAPLPASLLGRHNVIETVAPRHYVLTLSCPDIPGVVCGVSGFLVTHECQHPRERHDPSPPIRITVDDECGVRSTHRPVRAGVT